MFLEIENEVYALDLNKMINFVFEPNNNKNIESSQTLLYATDEGTDSQMKLVSKQLTENKSNDNSERIDTIRYDLTRQLLDVLMGIGVKTNPFGDVVEQDSANSSLDDMTVGEVIAFNTFLNEGFLINVNQN